MPPTDLAVAPTEAAIAERQTERMVLVCVDEHLFALPVERIREVVFARPYTPLPGADAAIRGLINLRGRMVTVVDLGVVTRLTPAGDEPEHSVAILQHGAGLAGLAVDDVAGMVEAEPAALSSAADALRAVRVDRAYLRGLGEDDGRIFVALDPDAILAPLLG